MQILITGCSGFIGQELKAYFEDLGHKVKALSIREDTDIFDVKMAIKDVDVVINLAGASIFGYWSESYKKTLYSSRIDTTRKLVEAMKRSSVKRFISTSAVGIYPDEKLCDEDTTEFSNSYLAYICKEWEKEAKMADVPTTIFRFGIVLGKNGGIIKKVWFPFFLGLGGVIGSGEQSMSWVHIKDLCGAYKKAIDDNLNGTYNLCSTQVITNHEFTKELGQIMHRPTFIPVPSAVLQLMFSEGADFMLKGQRVYPKKLLEKGFHFEYKTITHALKSFFS